jgi:hypothetical protein
MSVKQIPNLPVAVFLSPSAAIEIVQDGVSMRASAGQIAALNTNAGGSLTIVNDITDTNSAYPLFAKQISGSVTTVYTSDPSYNYLPSQGRLTAKRTESSQGIALNANSVTENYIIPNTDNALSAGPLAISALITVPVGSMWVVV